MAEYRFSPIDKHDSDRWIRILTVLPGSDSEPVACRLSSEQLSLENRYEALSYCWGTDQATCKIHLADVTDNRSLLEYHIRLNLFLALRRLRLTDTPRRLWVDAICINQDDLDEKASQIRRMADIYRNASCVLIWLGEESDGSKEAIDFIPTVLAVTKNDLEAGVIARDIMDPQDCPEEFPPHTNPLWESLYKLPARPWFKRAWIVQELAVATEARLICGPSEIPWDSFPDVFTYLDTCGPFNLGFDLENIWWLYVLQRFRLEVVDQDVSLTILQVLPPCRAQLKADPRDAVYAFHGLFKPGSLAFRATLPDYHTTDLELCMNVAHSILTATKGLEVLSIVKKDLPPAIPGLPSWVPDWNTGPVSESIIARKYDPIGSQHVGPAYAAAAGSCYIIKTSENDRRLHLRGYAVAKVEEISVSYGVLYAANPTIEDAVTIKNVVDSYTRVALGSCRTSIDQGTYLKTGENFIHAFWKTLVLSNYQRFDRPVDEDEMFRFFSAWRAVTTVQKAVIDQAISDGEDLKMAFDACAVSRAELFLELYSLHGNATTLEEISDLVGRAIDFSTIMGNLYYRRRMMRTANDMIGVVPGLAEAGDIIILAEGGCTPFVLRPKHGCRAINQQGDEYEHIGEAYVHGLMDGADWTARADGGQPMEEFILV